MDIPRDSPSRFDAFGYAGESQSEIQADRRWVNWIGVPHPVQRIDNNGTQAFKCCYANPFKIGEGYYYAFAIIAKAVRQGTWW